MIAQKISLLNFKNYEAAELELNPGINCFLGDNGAGKTNLLDALYYLSFCKSYFNAIDSQNTRDGAELFMIEGEYAQDDATIAVSCGMKRGHKKQMRWNKKEYSRLADHVGKIPLVLSTPSDTDLILGGSDVRRKLIDGIISQYDSVYLSQLLKYNKVVVQRNAWLKKSREIGAWDEDTLAALDMQLVMFGEELFEKRKAFLHEFVEAFQNSFDNLVKNREEVSLQYCSALESDLSFAELLSKARSKDRAATYSTVGIHRDDLEFLIGGKPLKKFGSQGQQKSYIVALKFAQYHFIKSKSGKTPLLLLDDIFDKLDDDRVAALLRNVSSDEFGQIFITDTSRDRIIRLLTQNEIPHQSYWVDNGTAQPQEI